MYGFVMRERRPVKLDKEEDEARQDRECPGKESSWRGGWKQKKHRRRQVESGAEQDDRAMY